MTLRALCLATLLTLVTSAALAATVEKRSLVSEGIERSYLLFVPEGVDRSRPTPLLVLLHGSGGSSARMIERWRGIAEEQTIILAAPDSLDPRHWSIPDDGPQFLIDVVELVKQEQPADPRRVYLFGHSAGAGFSLQMGLLESEYFAAVALHAAALEPKRHSMTAYARRKIPFAMFIGTKDPYVPLAAARATRDLFEAAGIPVRLTELPKHDHNYARVSDQVNASAWAFLQAYVLSGAPKAIVYTF